MPCFFFRFKWQRSTTLWDVKQQQKMSSGKEKSRSPIIWCCHSREVYCFVIVQARMMKNMKNINEYYLVIMFIFMTVHWSGPWKKDLQKMKFHPHFYARAIQMVEKWIKRFVKRTLHLRALLACIIIISINLITFLWCKMMKICKTMTQFFANNWEWGRKTVTYVYYYMMPCL